MSKVKVQLSEVIDAMESVDGMGFLNFYLNIRTGKIHLDSDDMGAIDEEDEGIDFEEDEDYAFIPGIDSDNGFWYMESFVKRLAEGEIKTALTNSLAMRKPFRKFKDTLRKFPDTQEEWYAHEARCIKAASITFLQDLAEDCAVEFEIIE